jgi:hypothetical protein
MSQEDYRAYEEKVNQQAEENPENYADFEQMEEIDEAFSLNDLPSDDEVLKLTEFDGNLETNSGVSIIAEYRDIDIVSVDKKHEIQAKNFVTKITKFILDFKDLEMTPQHESYLKEVAKLELSNLVDMMSLVDVNKQMLNNMVRRVNSVQAEDYAMIATYNNLVNLQIKLVKELQNSYRQLPSVLKKMRAEVVCNQELPERTIDGSDDEPITEQFGTLQFNNTKQLLKTLRDKKDAEKLEKEKAAGNAA